MDGEDENTQKPELASGNQLPRCSFERGYATAMSNAHANASRIKTQLTHSKHATHWLKKSTKGGEEEEEEKVGVVTNRVLRVAR